MEQMVREAADSLLLSIRESRAYKQYIESVGALKALPEIFQQVIELQKRTIELYQEKEDDELLEDSDRLALCYDELQKIPEVTAYVEAEEELIITLQEISRDICSCVDLLLSN